MDDYEPKWVLVDGGRTRCQECGDFVKRSWHWFPTLTKSTICWCESCVDIKLEEAEKI